MGIAACGLGALAPATVFASADVLEKKPVNEEGQQLFIGEDIAVTDTKYGKVKGFVLRDIVTFRGIPYGGRYFG